MELPSSKPPKKIYRMIPVKSDTYDEAEKLLIKKGEQGRKKKETWDDLIKRLITKG